MRAPFRAMAGVACASVLAACGGGGNGGAAPVPDTTGAVRVVHASPDVGLVDVAVDGEVVHADLGTDGYTEYFEVAGGPHVIEAIDSYYGTVVLHAEPIVAVGARYSVIGYTGPGGLDFAVVTDGAPPPRPGYRLLREVHAAPGLGAVDVYVTPHDAGIAGRIPLWQGVVLGQASSYAEVPADTVSVYVTRASTSEIVVQHGLLPKAGFIETMLLEGSSLGAGHYQHRPLDDRP